jgi:uncharacterized protein with HEPN domain
MEDRNLFRLGHIRDYIAKVEYPANRLHNYDNFEEQWIEQDAIIRNLEIIDEASVGCISICRISKSKDILFERIKMFCSNRQRCFVRADKDVLFERTKMFCSSGQRCFVQ